MKTKFAILSLAASLALLGTSRATVLVDWTFETSQPTGTGTDNPAAGGYTPEVGQATALGKGHHNNAATAWSSPSGNGSAHSFSATAWSANTDYFQFTLNTLTYQNIMVSFDQMSSNTGPANFKLAYSTNGTTFTDFQSYAVVNDNWTSTTFKSTSHYTFDLSAITALNNAPAVFFRLIDTSTTAVNGGTVAAGGTDRVDNFEVDGSTIIPVPEPATTAGGILTALGLLGVQRRRLLALVRK